MADLPNHIGEGWDLHSPRATSLAMAFSVAVEMLNICMRARMKSVPLRKRMPGGRAKGE